MTVTNGNGERVRMTKAQAHAYGMLVVEGKKTVKRNSREHKTMLCLQEKSLAHVSWSYVDMVTFKPYKLQENL